MFFILFYFIFAPKPTDALPVKESMGRLILNQLGEICAEINSLPRFSDNWHQIENTNEWLMC